MNNSQKDKYVHICSEWSADFLQKGMNEDAGFWKMMAAAFKVKTLFDAGSIDFAIEECTRRETLVIDMPTDLEHFGEALKVIAKEARVLRVGLTELKLKSHKLT